MTARWRTSGYLDRNGLRDLDPRWGGECSVPVVEYCRVVSWGRTKGSIPPQCRGLSVTLTTKHLFIPEVEAQTEVKRCFLLLIRAAPEHLDKAQVQEQSTFAFLFGIHHTIPQGLLLKGEFEALSFCKDITSLSGSNPQSYIHKSKDVNI